MGIRDDILAASEEDRRNRAQARVQEVRQKMRDYLDDYEFRDSDNNVDYKPTEAEVALIEDAIEGLLVEGILKLSE